MHAFAECVQSSVLISRHKKTLCAVSDSIRGRRFAEDQDSELCRHRRLRVNLITSAKITTVVATSDVMALACMEAAGDLDIEVPRKLSIVGFYDIPEAVQAGFTTIR
jgi:DNA-binding LacI/PurR family transcriptional regulator